MVYAVVQRSQALLKMLPSLDQNSTSEANGRPINHRAFCNDL